MTTTRTASSSRRPRLPRGFVRLSSRRRAASASRSSGTTTEAMRRSRAITAPASPGGPARLGRLHDEGTSGDHQHHLVGGPRDGLIDQAERVAKAPAERRLRVDPPADLVRDEDEGEARARWRRPPAAPASARRSAVGQLRPFVEHVCDPEVETVHDDDIGLALERGERRRERQRDLDGAPGSGAAPPGGGRSGPPSPRRPPRRSRRTRPVRRALGRERRRTRSSPRGRPPGRGRSAGSRRAGAGSPAGRDRVRQPGPPSKTGSECAGPRQVS